MTNHFWMRQSNFLRFADGLLNRLTSLFHFYTLSLMHLQCTHLFSFARSPSPCLFFISCTVIYKLYSGLIIQGDKSNCSATLNLCGLVLVLLVPPTPFSERVPLWKCAFALGVGVFMEDNLTGFYVVTFDLGQFNKKKCSFHLMVKVFAWPLVCFIILIWEHDAGYVLCKARNQLFSFIQMSLGDYPCRGIKPAICHLKTPSTGKSIKVK